MKSDKLFKLIFRLTNQSVDISKCLPLPRSALDRDGGLRLEVTLKLPLVIRRLHCPHQQTGARRWCFRCERMVNAVVLRAEKRERRAAIRRIR